MVRVIYKLEGNKLVYLGGYIQVKYNRKEEIEQNYFVRQLRIAQDNNLRRIFIFKFFIFSILSKVLLQNFYRLYYREYKSKN